MNLDDLTDAQLLCAHARGETSAFEVLYDRYDRRVFDYIRRLVEGHVALAEDLSQETWMNVAKSAAQFDASKARFITWLFTIAHNKVMDHYRKRDPVESHPRVPSDADVDAPQDCELEGDDTSAPELLTQNRQFALAFVHGAQALPQQQREAFLLFAQELSLLEISQLTGAPVETVKSRIRYARNSLRTTLREWSPAHV